MSSEKHYTAIRPPPTIYKEDPRAVLSEHEQKLYDEVLDHFAKEDYSLPHIEKGQLTDDEKFWLSRECLLRYLRAVKWKNAHAAIHRLEATLSWRRQFGLYDLVSASHVEPEAVTGKEILYGYDVKGKPAFYMIPSRQNTNEATRQVQYAVWMLERCIDLMEPGVENIALLINFADRAKNPSIGTARTVLNILQDHYPERLGLALIINVPFLVNAFFKIIMPFVDPVTREKVKFNPHVLKDGLFTPDMLMKEWWEGDHDFEYVHEKYWGDLVGLCEKRVTGWKKAWRAQGAKVGQSEWAYKKGKASAEDGPEGEFDDDKKEEKVTITEAPAAADEPPVVSKPPKKAAEPEVQPEKPVDVQSSESPKKDTESELEKPADSQSSETTKRENTGSNPAQTEGTTAAQSGPSTVAVSGAGAVSGGGGGGDAAAAGGDGGGE
ncbi:unnamed protein product [Cyclocybe aegerita]|uniref:CRAL-TRIO domain-containing protein n=1 Tax=Cyclocybe aegerita TaxID=1973307 RepID=A0A8S0X4F1_CYCAE|nr:unnamed protein product [Cyclocybe aegerita]